MILVALPWLRLQRPLVLAAVAAVVVALVLVAVPRRRAALAADEARYPGLASLRRTTSTCRALAVVVGVGVLVMVAGTGPLGRGLALAPAAFAAVQVLGVLVADLLARDSARRPGIASLEVRRVRDYLPRPLTAVVAVLAVALLGGLAWAAAVAAPDDLGRAGRSLAYRCSAGCDRGAHGPWPGSYYALPMAVGLVALLAVAAIAMVVTVRRPRDGSDPELVRLDDAVRRRSVESVVAAVGTAFAAALAGVGPVAAMPVLADGQVPAALRAGAGVLVGSGLVALPVLASCVLVLLLPVTTAAPGRVPGAGELGAAA